MAYRYGDREQAMMFPPSIEEYVSEDDPVRAYDAFVDALDFDALGLSYEVKAGCPQYDPKAMLKLLLYGYSYGIRSSRKLERATYHNISFIWLTGGLKPDHKTISEFRRNNKKALKKVMRQCAVLCLRLGLIEGNTLFVDASRIRANASINNSWSKEKIKKRLKKIDKRIDAILNECDRLDKSESESGSLVKMRKELATKEALKKKIHAIKSELEEKGKPAVNTTDRDCVRVKGRQGSHAGYSGHIVVDDAHGLIVSADVVSENTDEAQFANQVGKANDVLSKKCSTACADAGYANTEELKKVDDEGIAVIVPTQKQASKKEPGEFDKERFSYDKERDLYVCPAGEELINKGFSERGNYFKYRAKSVKVCLNCVNFGVCTKSKSGRQVIRLKNEAVKEKLEKQYASDGGQAVYKRRKERVEHPFGHLKRNLGMQSFLLRGIKGVRAEMSLLATCFNVRRMITLLGVAGLTAMRA